MDSFGLFGMYDSLCCVINFAVMYIFCRKSRKLEAIREGEVVKVRRKLRSFMGRTRSRRLTSQNDDRSRSHLISEMMFEVLYLLILAWSIASDIYGWITYPDQTELKKSLFNSRLSGFVISEFFGFNVLVHFYRTDPN